MPIVRSLLLLVVLLTPAFAQDGSRAAAAAKDAAQALQHYLDGVSQSGRRPDYTKPPAADLVRRVFDLEQLVTLPPPTAGEVSWVTEWLEAAKETYGRIMFFGTKPGPGLDQEAVLRNLREYEDQYAIALDFLLRLTAREATTLFLFIDQLPPEQRTPIREAGLQRARSGATQMAKSALGAVAGSMRPANARLVTAAMRDTADVWARFIPPDARTQIIDRLGTLKSTVTDDDVRHNLAIFRDRLAAEPEGR
jgi:hypothetical protein